MLLIDCLIVESCNGKKNTIEEFYLFSNGAHEKDVPNDID